MSATSLPLIPEPENVAQAKIRLKINDNPRIWQCTCVRFLYATVRTRTRETLTSSPIPFSSTVLGDGGSREGMLRQGTVIVEVVFEWVF